MPDQTQNNTVTVSKLQETGRKYRKDLVRLPVLALGRSTRYMTLRPGVRYEETVFNPEFNAEMQAYEVAERQKTAGEFGARTLRTEFGACFFDFDPNQVISTLIGHAASQAGEGAAKTPGAREVAGSVLKNIGRKLNIALIKGKKQAPYNKTNLFFDGFEEIIRKGIEAGEISAANGNLLKISEKLTAQNAERILKKALFAASDELRDEEEDAFIYCGRDVMDAYNESYLMTHTGLNYNTKYKQPILEGSEFTFAPLAGMRGSRYIIISTKKNMLVGCDQMSDTERVEFHKYAPKVVTGELYMFIGCQFESVDPRRLLIIELPENEEEEEDPEIPEVKEPEGENGGQIGDQGENGSENDEDP